MPPDSPNPDPISDQENQCRHYSDKNANKKEGFFKSVLNLHIFVLVSYSFGIEFPETIIRSFTPLVSSITIPDTRPKLNGQSLYPFSDQNAAKTISFGAGTYMAS